MSDSGSGAFSSGAGNTSGFDHSAFCKPTTEEFGTPQPSTEGTRMFEASTTDAFSSGARNMSGFGQLAFGKPSALKFGVNTGGTSLIGIPTATSESTEEFFGQQNASMGENTGGGLFGSSNPNTSSIEQSKPAGTGFTVRTPIAQPRKYSDRSGFNKNVKVKEKDRGDNFCTILNSINYSFGQRSFPERSRSSNDNYKNLSWSIKATGWYSILIVSNVEDNDEVLKIIQSYIMPAVFYPYNKLCYRYALGFLVDDYKVAKTLHEANYKMIQRDDLKLTIKVSSYLPSSLLLLKSVSSDIIEKMKDAIAIRYNPSNKSLDLSTFHACPFFTNYQLFVPLNRPKVLYAALNMVDEHIKNGLYALSLENNYIFLGKNLKWICQMFPNLKVLNLAGNKLSNLKQLKRLSNYAIEELSLSRNPVRNTKDQERYRRDVKEFCPSLKYLFVSEVPSCTSVVKSFSNGWNEE